MAKCDGCKGEFEQWELVEHMNVEGEYCIACTYELEAKLDAVTDNE